MDLIDFLPQRIFITSAIVMAIGLIGAFFGGTEPDKGYARWVRVCLLIPAIISVPVFLMSALVWTWTF